MYFNKYTLVVFYFINSILSASMVFKYILEDFEVHIQYNYSFSQNIFFNGTRKSHSSSERQEGE